jgi:phage FluMu protein Com
METVQLQCGSCNKLMAISVAHLGGQVKCPHCQSVVQTPAPATAPPNAAPPQHVVERESIFAGPEAGDDLFGGGPPAPQVEYPPAPAPAPPPVVPATVAFNQPDFGQNATAIAPAPAPAMHDFHDADGESELPAPRPRPLYDKSMGPLIALIFLVPYSILTTLFIIYLLMQLWGQPHPLDMLPDPVKKGEPKRVERIRHDYPLASHQKVGLGSSLRVGELEVQPQKVEKKDGNLVLELRVKNVSSDQAFSPLSDQFLHVQKDRDGGKPYTFLQSESFQPVYGGFLEVRKGAPGKEIQAPEGDLAPGQGELIVLTTMDNDQKLVKRIVESKDRLVWRVQLRRGLVPLRGKQISATTIVGVQFSAGDIK